MIKKKILLLLVFVVLLVVPISAIEWNDKLTYSNNDLTVSWENWWGLGKTIGIAELKSHSSVDEIKKVAMGKEVVMWYDFNFSELYEDGLGDVEFTDMRTGEIVDRKWNYVYWGERERDVYGDGENYNIINGTKVYERIIVGTKTYNDWLPYNSKDIPSNNIRIGIKVEVKNNDYIDGVWTIAGKKVSLHAIWEEFLNVGLLAYWKLDDITLAIDAVTGTYNGTNQGADNVTGIINSAYNFTGIDNLSMGNVLGTELRGDITISLWIKSKQLGFGNGNGAFVSKWGPGGADNNFIFWAKESDNSINLGDLSSEELKWAGGKSQVEDGNFHNLVAVRDNATGNAQIWFDGVSVANESGTSFGTVSTAPLRICGYNIAPTFICIATIDEVGIWNRTLNGTEIVENLYNGGAGNTFTDVFIPTVTLNSPIDNFNSSFKIINFNGSVISPSSVVNVTLFIDGILNETNASGINDVDYLFTKSLSLGNHNWTYEACSSSGCTVATTRDLTVDTSPTINVFSPTNDTFVTSTIFFNATAFPAADIWIVNYNGTNTTLTNINTTLEVENGFHQLLLYANNSATGVFGLNDTIFFTKRGFFENSQTFNASSFETDSETFTINITTDGTVPTDGKLIYNGTTFSSATITNTAGNDFDIIRTIDIPLTAETKPWFFNVTVGTTEESSSSQTQIINSTTFVKCTTFPAYINITFKNETVAEETVSAEIDSDWNFWLGSGSIFKQLTFTNTSENFEYSFCLTSGNQTLNTNVSLDYDNSISEQRSFISSFILTNTTTNQTLFLLPTTDGIFVTFQTVTAAEQVIDGVFSNVTKSGDLISTGITDDAGLVQYFLDPDTTYVFSFSKIGFDLVTTTLKPTQSSFTIIMGGVTPPVGNDTTKGINYVIRPLANVLGNNTATEFNLTFSSTFWSLDLFGFTLKNSTGSIFNTTSSTTQTGGFLSQTLNTGNNTDLIMEVFWTIDGNQTNVSRLWKVLDTTDEGFSIKTFFDDLSIYLTSGMFGLTSFGLGIIIFMIILITTGILSTKFGIITPVGLSIIVFSMVLFFDVGLGIMPNPIGAVPNFPSIFIGVIFLGLLLKEAIIR